MLQRGLSGGSGMINTMFQNNTLETTVAFLAAFVIGIAFGFFLEQAGFSSSRKLAGVFYLTDMTVVKVMFTAMLTTIFGLGALTAVGWLSMDQLYLLPTIYGAQIAGGLLFGVGFVVGGWCPGTAVAGIAAGKLDALIFVIGAIFGSVLFNELFGWIKPLYQAGQQGVLYVYVTLGMSKIAFTAALAFMAVVMFWVCEWIESRQADRQTYLKSPFLKAFSLAILIIAAGMLFIPRLSSEKKTAEDGTTLLTAIQHAQDHIEPEELANRLMQQEPGIVVVDVRPAVEYNAFHIRGAINILLSDLPEKLIPYKQNNMIVLYSNGMTHPAQARDILSQMGFPRVYLLTDGLEGFVERCIKPVSLRSEPVPDAAAGHIADWRKYFLASNNSAQKTDSQSQPSPVGGLVETDWLEKNLSQVKILDFRTQPEYSAGHIPGSLCLSVESLRGNINGVGSMLLPPDMLARQMSLMGIQSADRVILVYGDKPHDATIAAMAFRRVGHAEFAILDGGFAKWASEKRPLTSDLPEVQQSLYSARAGADDFTIDYRAVLQHVKKKDAIIIDVRPADYYKGVKSDEARAGHIPGAINRPYTEDVVKSNSFQMLKPVEELEKAYQAVIPSKESVVIVHCRTGHQASQTFMVLRDLLGYHKVLWYDAGWTEWAALKELPIEP
jgi:thiosulfate/3-mercaptopyruvate sulfurtransferase